MTKLELQHKEELEAVLEQYFPKGNPGRSGALMLLAEAMMRIKKTMIAFGNCTKCYGKGYGTQTLRATGDGEADMGDADIHVDEAVNPYVPCTCERGQQIQAILNS